MTDIHYSEGGGPEWASRRGEEWRRHHVKKHRNHAVKSWFVVPRHRVERVMQEQIGQDRRNDAPCGVPLSRLKLPFRFASALSANAR